MAIVFEKAELMELDTLIGMMKELQVDDPWAEEFAEGRLREDLERLMRNASFGLVYVAKDRGHAVGYLVICFDYSLEYRGKGAWVDELFVSAAYRGRGIGTQLLDLAEDASKKEGAQVLHLEVNHGNKAKELYRRRGFVEHERFLMTKHLMT